MLRSRVWRPGLCVHATQGSGSSRIPPAPSQDGAAFNGWTRTDRRAAQAAWIRRGQLAGPSPEERPETRDATVERRKARVPLTRHAGAFAKVPSLRCAQPALRSLFLREEGNEGGAPRLTTSGADESRPYQ
jgi:hypothetical protein